MNKEEDKEEEIIMEGEELEGEEDNEIDILTKAHAALLATYGYIETTNDLTSKMGQLTLEEMALDSTTYTTDDALKVIQGDIGLEQAYQVLRRMEVSGEDIDKFLTLNSDDSRAESLFKIVGLRNLLSEFEEDPAQEVVKHNLVPVLIKM